MNEKFLRRVKRNDRIAKWVISLGGIAIIGAVILILVLIANVAVPLFLAPKADVFAKFPLAESGREGDTLAVGVDEYLETGYFLDASGRFHFFKTQDGKVTDTEAIEPPVAGARLVAADQYGRLDYGLLWSSGQLTLAKVKFRPFFDAENNNKRTIRHTLEQVATLPPVAGSNIKLARARISDEGRTTRVDLHNNNQLHLAQTVMTESLFGDTEEETYTAELTADLPGVVSTVV
ncbi:MAG: hypothetical protein GWN87_31900, partial [Desulfuromonadales bacterium]|nr:hypothetical protein [Desulfuromonadales bacterium]NIS44122.1 hypothetical protein [Desulfuromonadales bacterium]